MTSFQSGDRVRDAQHDSRWYTGTVREVHDDGWVDVQWDSAVAYDRVRPDELVPLTDANHPVFSHPDVRVVRDGAYRVAGPDTVVYTVTERQDGWRAWIFQPGAYTAETEQQEQETSRGPYPSAVDAIKAVLAGVR